MHGSRGEFVLGERVKEENGSKRKQESEELLALSPVESVEARRVKSVWNVGTESDKQDDEAIDSQSQDWKDIRNIKGEYEDEENVEKESEEENILDSVCALVDMPLMQRQDPELAELITYLSTGVLPKSDQA